MSWKNILKNKRPDYPDVDGDGDTTEPMVDALETVEQVESVGKRQLNDNEWKEFLDAVYGRKEWGSGFGIPTINYNDLSDEWKEVIDALVTNEKEYKSKRQNVRYSILAILNAEERKGRE